MKNRYTHNLVAINQLLINLNPGNRGLANIMALEFAKIYKTGLNVLEIGCGEGDSALPVLEQTTAVIRLLDESPEMISLAQERLSSFSGRTLFTCEDALSYLKSAHSNNIIFSVQVIHNFTWPDKIQLLQEIYKNLRIGGYFLWVDKIYPDEGAQDLFNKQMRRYSYLEKEDEIAMVQHETEDYLDDYRMDESRVLTTLSEVGFKTIELIDRFERDVLFIAQK